MQTHMALIIRSGVGTAFALMLGVILLFGMPADAQQAPTPTPGTTLSAGDLTRTAQPTNTPRPTNTAQPTRTPTPDPRLPTFALPLTSLGYQMRVSPDDLTIAVFNLVGAYGNIPDGATDIVLLDTLLGEPVATLTGATDFALDVAYTPDSATLISYHQNGDLNLWDTTSGEQRASFRTYYISNNSRLYATQDGERVIIFNSGVTAPTMVVNLTTGYVEQFIGLYHLSTNALRNTLQNFPNFDTETQFAAFAVAPDESGVYFANANADIFRWDDARELSVWREAEDKAIYDRLFAIRRMAFTPDSAIMVFSDEVRGAIRWIDMATQTEIGALSGIDLPIFGLSPDASHIAWAVRGQRAVYLAPLTNNGAPRLIANFDPAHQPTPTTRLVFSADGRTLYVGGLISSTESNAVYVIDLSGVDS